MFTVVVPALNEEAALTILLPSLLRALEPQRILVVDNGSTDGTSDVCQHFGIPTLLEPHKGKGNAVLAGVAAIAAEAAVPIIKSRRDSSKSLGVCTSSSVFELCDP